MHQYSKLLLIQLATRFFRYQYILIYMDYLLISKLPTITQQPKMET